MKLRAIILGVCILYGENFNQIEKLINNSNLVKIYQKNIEIQKEKLKKAKAKNYGKIDLEYTYSHLFEKPYAYMDMPEPVAAANLGSASYYPLIYKNVNAKFYMGDKNNFIGMLAFSYPVFTGFAISNLIDIEKLNLIKSKLELKNIKRNLLLNAAKLYANIYALNKKIIALKEAKTALLSAKDKAYALYKEGLLNKSTLDDIDAKYYETDAKITQTKSEKKTLLNMLGYLLNTKITSISVLPNEKLQKEDILNRPDIKAIKTTLNITQDYINVAKSSFYPKIYFQAGIKKEANDLGLDKNNYQNIDKSYVALSIQYNIFNGGEDRANVNEAKLNRLKTLIYFTDYIKKAKTDYKNDLLMLNALKKRLKAAKSEIKARESYYKYIRAKFDEGLADVTDLNDAIAKLAESKAKRDYIKSQIFFYTLKANVDGGSYEK